MRSITLVPDGADTRDMVGGAWFKLGNRAKFTTAEDEKFADVMGKVALHVERLAGKKAGILGTPEFLLSFQGQDLQTAHQDSAHPGILVAMLFVSNGLATQFGDYERKIGLAWPRPSGTPIGRDAGRNA